MIHGALLQNGTPRGHGGAPRSAYGGEEGGEEAGGGGRDRRSLASSVRAVQFMLRCVAPSPGN